MCDDGAYVVESTRKLACMTKISKWGILSCDLHDNLLTTCVQGTDSTKMEQD